MLPDWNHPFEYIIAVVIVGAAMVTIAGPGVVVTIAIIGGMILGAWLALAALGLVYELLRVGFNYAYDAIAPRLRRDGD